MLLQRRERVLEIAAHLLGTDGVLVAPMIDTYRLHAAEVGRVTVRAGQHEEPAELRVVVEQLEAGGRAEG